MKRYRVSGFIADIGAAQVDVDAYSIIGAGVIAREEYGFIRVIKVTELHV